MNSTRSIKVAAPFVLSAALAGAVACSRQEAAPPAASNPQAASAPPPANMKAFMVSVVGPATQPIWDKGYADKLSDEDWGNLRRAAADLTGSVSTIASGGSVAAEQARAKSSAWQDWTKKMAAAAADAKKAADGKDQMGLATAGDALVEICEGCHMAFDPTAK